MRKTKFWLVQIVMLVMVSLVFGSAAFAGPPDGKGKGADTSMMALTNHAGNSQAWDHASNANDNAAFMSVDSSGGTGDGTDDSAPTCSAETPEVCTDATCPVDQGALWFDGVCYF